MLDLRYILFTMEHSCKLRKPTVANYYQSMQNLKDRFCLIAIEIQCADSHDFGTKAVGVLSRNVLWTNPPAGGAVTGPCEKLGSGVLLPH